jgi:site-specific recombinase XerD
MDWLTQYQVVLRAREYERHDRTELETEVRISLATGARWFEGEELKKIQLEKHKITYTNAKGRKNRAVPISKELYESLPDDKKGRLFSDCYGAFRSALDRTGIELPAGQLTHVLRHTFASHFMMDGGNILVLQRVLGHTDIKTTMRYSHFAPDHLEDAIRFNPLRNLHL